MTTYISIGNQVIDSNEVSMPSDRKFREAWVLNGDVITIDINKAASIQRGKIKKEALKRIENICPEWKQRNLLAQANILNKKGEANWTAQEAQEWADGEALWDSIMAIRTKSNQLEALSDSELVSLDVEDDANWS